MADTGKAKEEKERMDFDIETKDNKDVGRAKILPLN